MSTLPIGTYRAGTRIGKRGYVGTFEITNEHNVPLRIALAPVKN